MKDTGGPAFPVNNEALLRERGMTLRDFSELISSPPTLSLATPPKPVGYWVLYPGHALQTRFGMFVRPTDEQIKNTEALLGWGWEEA